MQENGHVQDHSWQTSARANVHIDHSAVKQSYYTLARTAQNLEDVDGSEFSAF